MKTTPLLSRASRARRGATTGNLVTALVVLALFGVIAAIIIPTVGKVRETAQRSVEASDRRQREMMLEMVAMEAAKAGVPTRADEGFGTEAYDAIRENRFVRAANAPLSTFSIDVDTASYANVRRFLNEGRLPPRDAVWIEEQGNFLV